MEKELVMQKVKALIEKAKREGIEMPANISLKSGNSTSLSKVIRTKEQADAFMRKLEAL